MAGSPGRRETRGHVAPTLVIVDAESDDEVFVVAFEAEDAGGATPTHGEDVLIVGDSPRATVGEVPNGLLDDLEPGAGVALVEAAGDGVGHDGFWGEVRIWGREKSKGCALDLECL